MLSDWPDAFCDTMPFRDKRRPLNAGLNMPVYSSNVVVCCRLFCIFCILIASCCRNWDKLWQDKPLGSTQVLLTFTVSKASVLQNKECVHFSNAMHMAPQLSLVTLWLGSQVHILLNKKSKYFDVLLSLDQCYLPCY